MAVGVERYLGCNISELLQATPFSNWYFEKSFENDLEELIIHYVFSKNGMEVRCDHDDRISVIFLYSSNCGGLEKDLFEISFAWHRSQVRGRFGIPSKSSNKIVDPVLGSYGAWDRFSLPGYSIHFEYLVDSDRINNITLMREDVVPR